MRTREQRLLDKAEQACFKVAQERGIQQMMAGQEISPPAVAMSKVCRDILNRGPPEAEHPASRETILHEYLQRLPSSHDQWAKAFER